MIERGRLNDLEVKGFKSIGHLKLKLRPLNLIIGANGAGKSNFMELFRFMNNLLDRKLQIHVKKHGKADKYLHFGRKTTPAIDIKLHFSPNSYIARLEPDQSGGLLFVRERCRFHAHETNGYGQETHEYKLANPGSEETGLPKLLFTNPTSAKEHVAHFISDWKLYHFHDTSESAPVKLDWRIRDSRVLHQDGRNLASFMNHIVETPAYEQIVRTVQRVAPFFHDFVLRPDEDDPKLIRLRWKHVGSDIEWDANDLSDGTLRFICLATLLLQPEPPTTILLDEPELGLHPYALGLLADMMRMASEKTQVIAATQSVTLANQFDWKDLIVVERRDNASTFRRLREREVSAWLENFEEGGTPLGMGDLWEKNIIGGNPK